MIQTSFKTNNPADEEFFNALKSTIQRDSRVIQDGDRAIRTNPFWFRDHVHEMKAYQWWETDLTSYVDRMLELQPERGFFFEIMSHISDPHLTYAKPEFRYHEEGSKVGFVRLEVEADIEYLMTEAVHTIWKATGDNEAMARRLPALEKGLRYNLEDPTRWDIRHGLVKRPFTIDSWDFVWGFPTDRRDLDPAMPMAIMHGDNSGVYQACLQVAEMHEALGNDEPARNWRKKAAGIRERANKLLWNGKFYIHQYHLDPVDTGCDESKMLSLSNTYDINRGMATHEMAISIIDEYRNRREQYSDDFAEWYALDPPYPNFVLYPAGEYINGGVGGFVAGELAKAAFHHGREEYGADILRRMREFVEKIGKVPFLAYRDGTDFTKFGGAGGPRGWSAAAILSAIMEGLAGIRDLSTRFRQVEIAPRYPAAGITEAEACLRYGPTDAHVKTVYNHSPSKREITVRIEGSPEEARFHVLLPPGAQADSVTLDGSQLDFQYNQVEKSTYCDFTFKRTPGMASVVVLKYH